MRTCAVCFLQAFVLTVVRGKSSRHLTNEETLINDLLSKYERDARGVFNSSHVINIRLQFMLWRIHTLDERSQNFITTGVLITEWVDERLTWNPKMYSGLDQLVVGSDRIWTPELAVLNGADSPIQTFKHIRILLKHDGRVHWEPGGMFSTTCDIDIAHFPFDTQTCPIEIGTWAYTSSQNNLSSVSPPVEMANFTLNGEWTILSTEAVWQETVSPSWPDIHYPKIVFRLRMRRRCTFYVMNIIVPCILLSVLILVVFCIPPEAGEKISAGISVLLAYTVFLLMIVDSIPRTSLEIPVLVIYLSVTMAFSTASVCLSAFVMNIHHCHDDRRVPRWARKLLLDQAAHWFGFTSRNPFQHRHHHHRHHNHRQPLSSHRITENGSFLNSNNVNNRKRASNNFQADNCCYGRTLHLQSQTGGEGQDFASNGSGLQGTSLAQSLDGSLTTGDVATIRLGKGQSGSDHLEARRLYEKEWQILARVVDRICFCFVFLGLLLSSSAILLSPWYQC